MTNTTECKPIPESEMWCGCREENWKSEKRFLTHLKKWHSELYEKEFAQYD